MCETITPLFPVFLDLRDKRCVVVGGGQVAMRKVESLRAGGADIVVVAPRAAAVPEGVTVMRRPFQPDDVNGAHFVIAATDDPAVNAAVADAATARGIWVNTVDDPCHCSAVLPATVRRGAFCLAVSTGGASPALARRVREQLEQAYGPEYGALIKLLGALRREWEPRAKGAGLSAPARRHAWEQLLDLPLLDWLRAGERERAEQEAVALLTAALPGGEGPRAQ